MKVFLLVAGLVCSASCRKAVPEVDLSVEDVGGGVYPVFGRGEGCVLNINGDLPHPQPLIIHSKTKKFIKPDKAGIVRLQNGETLDLHCTDTFSGDFEGTQQISPTCLEGTQFDVKGRVINFRQLKCKSFPRYVLQRTTHTCAEGEGTVAYVGFNVNGRLLPIMDICHDEQRMTTFYSHHLINPASENFQKSVPRGSFSKGEFFGKTNVDRLYKKKTQMQTFEQILDGAHHKFFENNAFLSRGHLSAKSDHILGAHQRATFNFLNVAPQWQSFNDGTWNAIEVAVRRLAAKRDLHLEVFTGTWGVSTLPGPDGQHKELFLTANEKLPVPKLFYKVVIDLATRAGIVLVGVNNPHITKEDLKSGDYVICDDISEEVPWFRWRRDNYVKGYSYACEVDDFVGVVRNLPRDLNVTGVLV